LTQEKSRVIIVNQINIVLKIFETEIIRRSKLAKIIGEIVTEIHAFAKVKVQRPRGNEFLIQLDPSDDLLAVQDAVRQAIGTMAPYVRNCTIGQWTGRATTYIRIQPISDELKKKFIEQLKEIRPTGLCLMTEQTPIKGRLQLALYTPSPEDPIRPADEARRYMDGPWLD
jgi:hypothetical protein